MSIRWPSCLYECRTNIDNSLFDVYSLLSARSPGVQRIRTPWMWTSSASPTAITGSIQDISVMGVCHSIYNNPALVLHLRHLTRRATSAENISGQSRRLADASGPTFQSDVSLNDLPDTVCDRDIKLFYLKGPDSKRDVLCAIIGSHNLKGRPEGVDG